MGVNSCHWSVDVRNICLFVCLFLTLTVYKAKYYGYLNSDILIEPVVFSVLNYLDKQARAGSISPYHELAGRVHPIDTTALPVGFSSLEEMEKCFAEAKEKGYELRNPCTAVCVSPYPHS